MKRFWIFVLLVSVGLNLGLGWRLIRQRTQLADRTAYESGGWGRGGGRDGNGSDRRGDGPRDGRGGGHGRFLDAPEDSAQAARMMERRLERLSRRLGLDPAQKESFLAAHREAAPRLWAHRSRITAKRRKLQELVMRPTVQPDSVWAAMRDMGRCQAELDSLATAGLLRELGSLDPRQREIYLQMMPWAPKPPRGE